MDAARGIAHFLALERAVWKALQDGDAAADARLLSDDFLGVYSSGFAARDDHVGQLDKGPTVAWFELSRARMRWLAEDVVALSYCARWARAPVSGTAGPRTMYVTSIWRREEAGWRNVFSQDTEAAA